jgi:hypothetical protein
MDESFWRCGELAHAPNDITGSAPPAYRSSGRAQWQALWERELGKAVLSKNTNEAAHN